MKRLTIALLGIAMAGCALPPETKCDTTAKRGGCHPLAKGVKDLVDSIPHDPMDISDKDAKFRLWAARHELSVLLADYQRNYKP